jgi:lipopolysaccharide/colanic/teichoic acid biosynthesis glycosyltransferase
MSSISIVINAALKRTMDVVFSAVGLVLLSPFLLLIALVIKRTSPGPVLYRATRVGRYGEPFTLYKFRSMVVDADQMGPGVTGAQDPRITPIGRFLRRTKLDEFPQLLNVIRGEMSLVGPRPEDSRYVALYTADQRKVLNVRPGITSLASVAYRNEEAQLDSEDWEHDYITAIMPAKLAIDLDYSANPTVWQDLVILFKTLIALFR